MTALYRSVLIKSAGQAEAMPPGTIAMYPHGHFTMTTEGRWMSPGGGVQSTAAGVVGYRALVPIEAEEETREHPRRHEKAPRAGEAYLRPATMTRLVTPWEEA